MSETDTTIQKCTIDAIGLGITGEDAEPIVKAVNKYLAMFAAPQGSEEIKRCLKCGVILGGPLGSFQWRIENGEGICSCCGWPCRARHDIQDDKGSIFNRPLEVILQYHPDNVATEGEDE